MRTSQIVIGVLLAVLIGVPVIARFNARKTTGSAGMPDRTKGQPTDTLVVVTPHVEQIRAEFGRAFAAWHKRHYDQAVEIDWRSPGGTSEIRKQLESQLQAAVAAGAFTIAPARTLKSPDRDRQTLPEAIIDAQRTDLPDIIFGGGSFEHNAFKAGVITEVVNPATNAKERIRIRLTAPPIGNFEQAYLDATFGENTIGIERLYDPDQHWFGVALSGFGIVFNRDQLREFGLPEPKGFADLGNPKLAGRIALSDARQSGSVATLYDSILNKEGWDRGWRILREMAANARYFTASSTQPPLDVSQGECVMGVAIDFYGRGQSQAVLRTGQRPEESRVGYIDPPGATYIDADPASIVNGTRRPELAKRFMQFLLTDEAQALWQFAPARGPGAAQATGDGVMIEDAGTQIRLGPVEYSLRRMPSRRAMYERYIEHFTDKTNPFQIASNTPLRGWRDLLGPLMGAFAIDSRQEMKAAWAALNAARTTPGFPSATLAEMEAAFYAFPTQTVIDKDGKSTDLLLTEQNYRAISEYTKRWRDPDRGPAARIAYTRFFQTQYRRVVELHESASAN